VWIDCDLRLVPDGRRMNRVRCVASLSEAALRPDAVTRDVSSARPGRPVTVARRTAGACARCVRKLRRLKPA